jgi:hypothetical protein
MDYIIAQWELRRDMSPIEPVWKEQKNGIVVKNGITDSMGDHPNIFMTYQWDLMGCFLLRA